MDEGRVQGAARRRAEGSTWRRKRRPRPGRPRAGSSWDLTPRQFCDLELLLNGGFSPLDRLPAARPTTTRVCERDAAGRRHPLADADHARRARGVRRRGSTAGSRVALRDPEGVMLAALHVEERLGARPRGRGRGGLRHHRPDAPGRRATCSQQTNPVYVGGRLEGSQLPPPLRLPRTCARRRPSCAPSSPAAGLAPRRRLPDPQPDAPRPLRAHPARRQGGARPTC